MNDVKCIKILLAQIFFCQCWPCLDETIHSIMERWNGKVALVTGASSGIGSQVCDVFVQNGLTVIGAARRMDKMQELAPSLEGKKGRFIPYKCDLSKDEEVYKMFAYIKENFKRLDVCVNNAGVAIPKPILELSVDEWRQMTDVNVIALCLCCKLSIELMRECNVNDGHIINVSSTVGHKVYNIRELHFYSASKFAVKALTEGIRQELKQLKSGIRISTISPGFVATEMTDRFPVKQMKELFVGVTPLTAKETADIILYILSTPANVEINDIHVKPTFSPN